LCPHALCWDNFCVQISIFVEQHQEALFEVQSGTFCGPIQA
jgi:hypothetical protein